jgi:valyl-tRNA synthetase
MSKSRGNVTTPAEPLDRFGPDAVRYWAASARLGVDTAYDPGQLRVGRRLAVKLLNVARFVLLLGDPGGEPTAAVDRAALARLADTVEAATGAFDRYDHAGALAAAEAYAWWFCDDHVELVKSRAYGATDPGGAASAVAGLRAALDVLLRLLAPVLPFATEEVWSWWRPGSVHTAAWPDAAPLRRAAGTVDPLLTELASWVLGEVRRAKSGAHVSVRAPVSRLTVAVDAGQAVALRPAAVDLALAARATHVELDPTATAPTIEVTLA